MTDKPKGQEEPATHADEAGGPPPDGASDTSSNPSAELSETGGDLATATETPQEEGVEGEQPPKPIKQEVEVTNAGPCKKHIKVTIDRVDIDERLNEKFSKMVTDAVVPGYRPGKAPRKLLERRYTKDVHDQLKAELLLQSLEQLAEEQKLNPISQPNIDPFKIDIPKDGPLTYEFDVEVAPEFEMPQYKGLKLKRPVKELTDEDVAKAEARYLRNYGTLVPKEGAADLEDYVVCDVAFSAAGQPLSKIDEITVRIDPQLAFKDGVAQDFGAKMKGVKVGETRTADVRMSATVENVGLRNQSIQGAFTVKEVKTLRLPELTEDFLNGLGVQNAEQLKEKVRSALQRQLAYEQRRAAREQVLQLIADAANWDLPQDLLARQARKTLQRRVMELQNAGYPEDEIRSQANLLRQNAMASTARALKEHFVLQKIAEIEDLDVDQEDVDYEIENIAAQSDESPRRVRARLEREDLMDSLMNQILEEKALNLVLDTAEYEDVPFEEKKPEVGAVEEQALPGADPVEPPAAPKEESAGGS